jgi:hypothetical protein
MSRKKALTDAQVESVARAFDEVGATALARQHGVSRNTIYRAVDEYASGQGETKGRSGKRVPLGEFGVTGLARFGGSIREDYNRIWQNLQTMVPLVKEMLDHPVVGATMFAVEMYIRTAEWTVLPGGTEEKDIKARDFLEECMNDMSHTFSDHITQALTMLSYGFAPFEIVYKRRQGQDGKTTSEYDDGRIGWRKFAFRSQDTLSPGHEWEFDKNGGIKGMYQKADYDRPEVFIPIEKMILYRTTAAKNNPQGRSALRAAYLAWYYAKNFAEIEGISAERMGGGLPVIYLGEGTSHAGQKSDFDFAKQVVRDVRSDEQAGLVFPYQKQGQDGRGILFELVSPPAKGVVDFNRAITRYNQQISQTLMAQFIFLGLTEYGTQSLAIELTELFSEAMNGWISVVADVLNRYIVPRLFAFNTFEVDHLPQFHAAPTQKVDPEKLLNAITLAVGAGVLLPDQGTEREVRKALDLAQRDEPDSGLPLADDPEHKRVKEQAIKEQQEAMQRAADVKMASRGEDVGKTEAKGTTKAAQLATSRVRRHKPVRNPADKAKQVGGKSAGKTFNAYLAEKFMILRRNQPGEPVDWEELANDYQQELAELWEEFVSEMADAVESAEPEFQQEIAFAMIDQFAEDMTFLGREYIFDGVAEGLKKIDPDSTLLSIAGYHMAANEGYINESLVPDIKQKLGDFFSDPENLLKAGALVALFMPMQARVESYSGQVWAGINASVGEYARQIGSPVYWARDSLADHCGTCLDYGEREYDSYDDLLAITGGVIPADGTICRGNCRCTLLVDEGFGWTRP